MKRWLVVLILLFFTIISGCSYLATRQLLDRPGVESNGLSKLASTSGYRFRSFSIYNAGNTTAATGAHQFKLVAAGLEQRWHWNVRIAKILMPSFNVFVDSDKVRRWRQEFEQGSRRLLPRLPGIVPWGRALMVIRRTMKFMTNGKITPLNVNLYLFPAGTPIHRTTIRHNEQAIPVVFYFPFPAVTSKSAEAQRQRLQDLGNMMTTIGHEYLHALSAVGDIGPFPNLATEEATAYTFGICLETMFAGSHFNLYIPKKKALRNMHVNQYVPSTVGDFLASKNILHLLGPGKINGANYKVKNKLFALCRAMIRHPVDLTKRLYPLPRLKPVHLFDPAKNNVNRP